MEFGGHWIDRYTWTQGLAGAARSFVHVIILLHLLCNIKDNTIYRVLEGVIVRVIAGQGRWA